MPPNRGDTPLGKSTIHVMLTNMMMPLTKTVVAGAVTVVCFVALVIRRRGAATSMSFDDVSTSDVLASAAAGGMAFCIAPTLWALMSAVLGMAI